ncbi:DUF732 domain-containing protein [Nocardia transvalensis]|uniref:DUF732 domain-containing protein n=1 Tax=Nocardia transvalensis TaxID=37333 RepID=UPI001893BADD|nr:DUF732 domain-containing protein [Nocardia transvalensis]MBF6328582.1 DUF732 domain-containing protein [Nocardia transvalensis]
MLRTRGKVAGVVVAIAATGLLAACGNNDSTASSTPTLKTSTTTASPTVTLPSVQVPPDSEEPAPEQPAPTTTVAPERPQPVEPTTGANTPPLSGKDQAFLDELRKRGVTPSSPDIALTAANYVCQGKSAGASDQEISTYVNAMAGSDPAFDPNKMPVEQAGKIYIDVATATYCK